MFVGQVTSSARGHGYWYLKFAVTVVVFSITLKNILTIS